MPMSAADIQADKDQLRAEFAIELRRVEVALEKAKDKAARELIEANKRRVEVAEVKTEPETANGRLQEKENANRVSRNHPPPLARIGEPAEDRQGSDCCP